MLGDTEHHRQGWIPAHGTSGVLPPRPRHRHGRARRDTQSCQRRTQPEREYPARRRLKHGRYPGSDVPRSRPYRSRRKRSTSAREGRCPGTGRARARMAHRTQTGRRLHPHDTRENTVLGLLEFNTGPGLARDAPYERQASVGGVPRRPWQRRIVLGANTFDPAAVPAPRRRSSPHAAGMRRWPIWSRPGSAGCTSHRYRSGTTPNGTA